ncbi:glycoside hydrolase family 172 protein [Acidobacterium sp. S8]|uniref:glycoside hydrolase family 172 protein n=1 Tax=Acidobacterium sp. S8 TaxID=1641854 RepID=UPI001C2051F0|nr:glycoside hydrolase family 172 protein [Acidobacterium sp. S8]
MGKSQHRSCFRHTYKLPIAILVALGTFLACGNTGFSQTSASDMGSLATLTPDVNSRMVSPENPTGQKGKGAMATPNPADPDLSFSIAASDLGKGWKVRPFIKVAAHSTVTIMDVDGPGTIEHIWMASSADFRGVGRASVLRFYWDNETTPSVETPMTDFFAIGHDLFAPVNSAAVVDVPQASMNCYWPMPFRKHARITFTNDGDKELPLLTFQIDYKEGPIAANEGYFHAQWRRATTSRTNPSYTILDSLKGEGRYVGTFLSWTQLSDGWFGEGEVKFFIDGDAENPTIVGTGTEDYFGADWGFPAIYSTPYVGNVLDFKAKNNGLGVPKWSLYRWHIADPIVFHKDLKVTIQALGWWPNGKYQPLADDVASVAYWYQKEPHTPFPAFPPLSERWPR